MKNSDLQDLSEGKTPEGWVAPEGRWFGKDDRDDLAAVGFSQEVVELIDLSASWKPLTLLRLMLVLAAAPVAFLPLEILPFFFSWAQGEVVDRLGLPVDAFVFGIGASQLVIMLVLFFMTGLVIANWVFVRVFPSYAKYEAGEFLVSSMWAGKHEKLMRRAASRNAQKAARQQILRIADLSMRRPLWLIIFGGVGVLLLAQVDQRNYTAITDEAIYRSTYFSFTDRRIPIEEIDRVEVGCRDYYNGINFTYEIVVPINERIDIITSDLGAQPRRRNLEYALQFEQLRIQSGIPVYRSFRHAPIEGAGPADDPRCLQILEAANSPYARALIDLFKLGQNLPPPPN